jgi:hypothetical protein
MRPNALIYGARYDKMMEAFGGRASSSKSERPEVRAGAGDGVQGAGAGQRCDLAGVRAQAATVQVAQLIG